MNLNVPFAEKDSARSVGARWDVARRTWYVENVEDLEPFRQWIPASLMAPHRGSRTKKPRRDSKPGVATPRRDTSLPDCGCTHVPPWEHCSHSEPALEGAELAHIRSMNGAMA